MKPYEEYQETDLDWLPRVPQHWKVVPNLACFDERNERDIEGAELLAVTMGRGVIKQSEITAKKDSSNQDKSNYKRVCVGDLAYNKMRMWQGAVGKSDYEGIVSPAYIILNPKPKSLPAYFHLLFRSPIYQKQSYQNSYGICDDQLSLRYFDFKRMYVPLPPLDEQKQIVSYLAAKNREIEAYIAAKRALLARLKELSAAVISRAVTQGLNAQVETKASGVEWLGDVPKHWEVKRLKFVVESNVAGVWGDDPTEDPEKQHENIVCVRVADFDMGSLGVSEKKLTYRRIDESQQRGRLLKKGDLLLEKSGGGENQPVGRVVLYNLEHKAVSSNFVARIRPMKTVESQFLLYYCNLLDKSRINAFCIKQTTGIQNLDSGSYFDLSIPVPPLEEQRAIVAFIESQLGTIREAQERIEREIELARELWTTLVATVVTGQVDVSDWEGESGASSEEFLEIEDEIVEEEAVFSED